MQPLTRSDILSWLKETDDTKLELLWHEADSVRKEKVGDEVFFRGLVEFSNYCMRQCTYCGIRAGHAGVSRYRMSPDEILACAKHAVALGYGTVVLQSGEDPAIQTAWVTELIHRIKDEAGVAITLSLGERSPEELIEWRKAGADRYLLRFETSNPELFARIHPSHPGKTASRVELLKQLRTLDYEVGSGIMVGIPGQTWDDLANDLLLFQQLDLDMIGIGPFIPHPDTPLGLDSKSYMAPPELQVPNTEHMTYRAVALARLLCPSANLPSTTALATVNQVEGRELGLQRGANIVMPNLTPVRYRELYEIYPGKACISETADQCAGCLRRRVESIGRTVGVGPGRSPNWEERRARLGLA